MQNTEAQNLKTSTDKLTTANSNYQSTLDTLKTKSDELTEAEKARLTVMKEIAQQRLDEALGTLALSYSKTTNEIKNQRISVESLKAQQSAYSKVINDISGAQSEYNELSKKKIKLIPKILEWVISK